MLIASYEHSCGINCETTAQKNTLLNYDVHIDEDTLFGLDGTFGFAIFENKDNSPDVIVGKSEIFPLNAARLTGISINRIVLSNDSRQLNNIYLHINENKPVIARVELGLLPYKKFKKKVCFGGYFVVICGYENNDEGNFLILSDNEHIEKQYIRVEDFLKAASGKMCPPINPNREMFVFNSPQHNIKPEKIGPAALRTTVRNYLKSPMGNTGISGLKKLKQNLVNWPTLKKGMQVLYDADDNETEIPSIVYQLNQFGRSIAEFGTDGALFRSMFSSYLYKLNSYSENPMIYKSAKNMQTSAEKWKQISNHMMAISSNSDTSNIRNAIEISAEVLNEIIELENSSFHMLKTV